MVEQQLGVNSGGVRINLRQWGRKNSPTVVMVHGYPDNSHVWDNAARLLAEEFRVVAYDVRGSGLSDVPTRTADYHLTLLAADFKAVIDAVSPDKPVHLVAHDWGSIQSWEPVTNPAMEHRIASFTSISGPCLDHIGHWLQRRITSPTRKGLKQLIGQLGQSWYVGMFHLPVLGAASWKLGLDRLWPLLLKTSEGISELPSATQKNDGISGIQLYRANVRRSLLRPRMRYTNVPVQLLIPMQDPYITPQLLENTDHWVAELWRETVDSGHWLPLKDPALVAEKVRTFVRLIEARKHPPSGDCSTDCQLATANYPVQNA